MLVLVVRFLVVERHDLLVLDLRDMFHRNIFNGNGWWLQLRFWQLSRVEVDLLYLFDVLLYDIGNVHRFGSVARLAVLIDQVQLRALG